jgi:lipase ATG15
MTSSSVWLILLYLSNFHIIFVRCRAFSSQHQVLFDSQATLSQPDDRSNSVHGFNTSPLSALSPSLMLKAKPTIIYKPRSLEALHRARLRSLHHQESEDVDWDRIETLGPDVEDRHTLSQLARMSGNAYALPGQKNWYEIDGAWNTVSFVHI